MKTDFTGPGATLEQEIQCTTALQQLLQQEQQALIDADTEAVMALLAEKNQLVASLKPLAAVREQALLAAGHPASQAGMQAWLASTTASSTAAVQCWSRLMALSRTAQQMNRINGLLIQRHMINNQAALDILQGRPAHGNVYGPKGQTAQSTQSRKRIIG
jgi:flagella synthesis protein FlgN